MSSATETLWMGIYLQRSWVIDMTTATILVPIFIFSTSISKLVVVDEDVAKLLDTSGSFQFSTIFPLPLISKSNCKHSSKTQLLHGYLLSHLFFMFSCHGFFCEQIKLKNFWCNRHYDYSYSFALIGLYICICFLRLVLQHMVLEMAQQLHENAEMVFAKQKKERKLHRECRGAIRGLRQLCSIVFINCHVHYVGLYIEVLNNK